MMKFALSCDENPGDPGAVHSGIVERTLNIAVAQALGAALVRCGQAVWEDFSITYVQRVAEANANGSNVLVACAHNASSNPAAEGAQLIICPGGDALFNQLNVANVVGQHLVADGIAGTYGVIHESVYECCGFDRCSVYVEFLFETNPRDVAEIQSPNYPTKAGESLCKALAQAFGFPYVAPTAGGDPGTVKPPPPPPPPPVPEPPPVGKPLPDPNENWPSNLPPVNPTPAIHPDFWGELQNLVIDLLRKYGVIKD